LLDIPDKILTRFLVVYATKLCCCHHYVTLNAAKNGAVCVDEPNDVFVAGLVRLVALS